MISINTPHPGLTVHEVLGGSERDLEDMIEVHLELFAKFASYVPFMRERAQHPPEADPPFVEHWWLARIDGEAAGVRYFKYVPKRHCGLSLGIAIRKKFRPLTFGDHYGRFSKMLILASLEQVRADAEATGQPVPVGIVAEMENYLHQRYAQYDFIEYLINYNEPSSTPEATEARGENPGEEDLSFRSIQLGLFKLEDTRFDPFHVDVVDNMVLAFLVDHYGLPNDHWAVRRALESIRQMPGIQGSTSSEG
jgi:hypothetical protein